ncbi:MAG: hypothetical protein O7D30_11390, partial [Rickettsia endosymbiont of Ixodes persulcatus]|nr:hypothetical protein [Rickettsia endosymbiont of Ixodes persulcatus]
NRSCSGRIHQPGDKVWLHQPRRTKGRCPKLQPNWEGEEKEARKKAREKGRMAMNVERRTLGF